MMKLRSTQDALCAYVERFNEFDDETIIQSIPNREALDFLMSHAPRVLLPDPALEQTYYFRWWVYRKHIKDTPDGRVVTEFHPDVPWAGKYNTIVCSAAHHTDEGRWLRDFPVLDEYIPFLYQKGGATRAYTNWLPSSILRLSEVRGSTELGQTLVDSLEADYAGWEETNLHESGMYWSVDDRDASEFSISGNGIRPTLNCYQVANARAIAVFARDAGQGGTALRFEEKARALSRRINEYLWDDQARFYKVLPLANRKAAMPQRTPSCRDVREIWGYLPWTFGVAPAGRADAFAQLLDVNGFRAAHGLTTAERRHPGFGLFYTGEELNAWLIRRGEKPIGPKGHECLWNGPSWPFSTCLALRAVANLLNSGERQTTICAFDYVRLLIQYALAHRRQLPNGRFIPWIDENLNPDTGDWMARTRLMHWDESGWSRDKGGYERGKDYNHSSFCDLVIGDLFGVRPTLHSLCVRPLFPGDWPYAVLEDVRVHGYRLDIRYENPTLGGMGYTVSLDGDIVHHSDWPSPFHEGKL